MLINLIFYLLLTQQLLFTTIGYYDGISAADIEDTFAENIGVDDTIADADSMNDNDKLSRRILIILDHYKNEDPIGVPGAPILDPMPIPPLRQSHPVATINFKNSSLYGLSKFRLKTIEADLTLMNVKVELRLDLLDVKGEYSMTSWFTRSSGLFFVKLTNVTTTAFANLTVDANGKIAAQSMNMDIKVEDIAMDFENLNFLGSVFQGIINSVGSFMFDSIKPFIITEINSNMRGDFNQQLASVRKTFPNSIPPLDLIIYEIRNKFRVFQIDPLKLHDYNYSSGLIGFELTRCYVNGFTNFYRYGNVSLNITNHVGYFRIHLSTQIIEGSSEWNLFFATGFLSRSGSVSFTIDSLNVEVLLSQSMDVRNSPTIEDLQLQVGNIQVRCDGLGTLDYLIEFVVNVFPNLLRFQILDAFENPLRTKIQEALDTVNIEEIVHDRADEIDRSKEHGFDIDAVFEQLKLNFQNGRFQI